MRKTGPKTMLQTELATSDNNTRTRVSNPSTNPAKSRSTRNKVQTSNADYLKGDEYSIIPSDTSNISDWEWIAGGFPCRDMIRERIIPDKISQQESSIPSLDPQGNIRTEILDGKASTLDSPDSPISIIPSGQSSKKLHPTKHLLSGSGTIISELRIYGRKRNKSVNFPSYEIVDSSEDNIASQELWSEEITTIGNKFKLRRSSRNLGTPQFYDERLYIDIIENKNQPGSAQNPIMLDRF